MNAIAELPTRAVLDYSLDPAPAYIPHAEVSRPPIHAPVEFHQVLDRVLRCFSPKGRNIFVTRMCDGELRLNISQAILSRALYCLLSSVFDAESWRGKSPTSILICTHRRVKSGGAMLEIADNGAPLPRRLMTELSELEHVPPHFLPGWQVLKCRELIEKNGGRLVVTSPLNGKTLGVHYRLFLPLAVSQLD